jgi:transcriptional regulator with XRE-family HTH domain
MNYEWIYPQIGELIRRRRKQFKLTQEKLASRLGMSRASLANIEIGRQNVLVHQLYCFAAALDLSPHDLLPQPVDQPAKGDLGELPLPPGLKAQQKEQITRLLRGSQLDSLQGKEGNNAKQAKR